MSEKMTAAQRDAIQIAIINFHFNVEEKKLKVEENDLAVEVWQQSVPEGVKALLLQLPDEWKNQCNQVTVSEKQSGVRHEITLMANHSLPVQFSHRWNGGFLNNYLYQKARVLLEKKKDLDKRKREKHTQVYGILKSCSTIPSLLKRWPEIESFVKKLGFMDPQPGKEMAPMISQLNSELGLPPK